MREKLWPLILSMGDVTENNIQNLIDRIREKIIENFVTDIIIQNTNQISKDSAANLSNTSQEKQIKRQEEYNSISIESYYNLINTLTSFIENNSL